MKIRRSSSEKQNLKRLLFAFPARRQSVSICLSFFVWQWFSHVGGSFQRGVFWLKLILRVMMLMMMMMINDCELVVVRKVRLNFNLLTLFMLSGRTDAPNWIVTHVKCVDVQCVFLAFIRCRICLQLHAQNKLVFNASLVFNTFLKTQHLDPDTFWDKNVTKCVADPVGWLHPVSKWTILSRYCAWVFQAWFTPLLQTCLLTCTLKDLLPF